MMESHPTTKPKPPPKPSPVKLKATITSERYFKENPVVPRQKPPLAPKPVLPARQPCPTTSKQKLPTPCDQLQLPDSVTPSHRLTKDTDSLPCDTERIIQDTWVSLQQKSILCNTTNQDSFSDLIISSDNPVKNKSTLYSSNLDKLLPSPPSDSVNSRLVRSVSDVTNNRISRESKATEPSLQPSSALPDHETENSFILVDKELPSNNDTLNRSSLQSNSSFLSGFINQVSSLHPSPASIGDDVVILRNKKPIENSRGTSWYEDSDSNRGRTNSIGNESFDGSNPTVRQRISSFWGSFGKGGKVKEKRDKSLFYYPTGDDSSQMESSDSGRTSLTSLNDSSNLGNFNNNIESSKDNKSKLHVTNDQFDRESNRSSISDESFDAESSTKLEQCPETETDKKERHKKKCFLIVNEFVTSERVFIDALKLLCHDFKQAVLEASKHQKGVVIPPSDFEKIINNLPQLLRLNEDLLKDIESRLDNWVAQPKMADIIVKIGPFLKLYSAYFQNFEAQTDYLDECCERYRRFAQLVKDFENSDRCKKLALKHYMLKPVQRIPQYILLLQNYLDNQDPESPDYEDTKTALNIVCDVANHANQSFKQGDHMSKLISIQSQLGDYEIIKPGRHFVKEGELYKLCRKDMQLRFFILLSDCLLYTSYYGSMTGLKVKYKLPLSDMKVSRSHNTDCATEFNVISKIRSFTLRAKRAHSEEVVIEAYLEVDQEVLRKRFWRQTRLSFERSTSRNKEECTEWVEALQKAINDYHNRQMTFYNRPIVPVNAINEPLTIGREAPVWIQDKRVSRCQSCMTPFTMTFRRHHCRACGKVVCSSCSESKAPMLYLEFNAERVCFDCYNHLLKEFDDREADFMRVIRKKYESLDEAEFECKIQEIRSLFKLSGQNSGRKKKSIPQRLTEVTACDQTSQISGWLLRRSKTRWKRLWFVLKEQVLYAYKASEDVVALDSIPVLGYSVELLPEGEHEDAGVENKSLFKLDHNNQQPIIFAADAENVDRWVTALNEATLLK